MKAKRILSMSIVAVAAITLSGCFTIKNTDGLKLAYEDVDRASSYASQLKSMRGVPAEKRNAAVDLYIDAKGKINSYLQKAITDASDYEVNNPKEEYLATGGTEKVKAFEDKVKEIRETKIMLAPAVWVLIAEAAIMAIWDLNQKNREEGRQKFEDMVKKYEMKNYEQIPSSGTLGQ